jgi:ribosome assembly protein SQT1
LQDAITTLVAHPSPKGYLITSGSADKMLRTWDSRVGTMVREHNGHQGAILDACLSGEGTLLVTAGDDGVCLVFPTDQ